MAPINPFDIVNRTPKSNCRKCGYPTCLAFGAAVAKTGGDPHACPYINLDGLAFDHDNQPAQNQVEKDQEFVTYLKSKVAGLDFKAIAQKFGATLADSGPDTLLFDYLGQQVQLSKEIILIDGCEPEDPRDQILLYNYISSPGDSPPANDWLGMESLPNSISKIKTLATYCEERLAKLFSTHPAETISSVVARLDPSPAPENTASFATIIHALPMVPQYLLFWEEDLEDNFAAKVKILFDSHVLRFLDLESLVFLSERLAEKIVELYEKK
jgi:hypothetical protein